MKHTRCWFNVVASRLARLARGLWPTGSSLAETDSPHLVPGSRIGHGLQKAFAGSRPGDPTSPFAAVAGALSAAAAFSREHYSTVLQKRPGREPLAWIGIYVPIVLLRGHLFEFYLDQDGYETLAERDRLHVLVHGPTSTDDLHDTVAVQIVSERALGDFAKAALIETRALAEVILPEARVLSRSFHGEEDAS